MEDITQEINERILTGDMGDITQEIKYKAEPIGLPIILRKHQNSQTVLEDIVLEAAEAHRLTEKGANAYAVGDCELEKGVYRYSIQFYKL